MHAWDLIFKYVLGLVCVHGVLIVYVSSCYMCVNNVLTLVCVCYNGCDYMIVCIRVYKCMYVSVGMYAYSIYVCILVYVRGCTRMCPCACVGV